MIKSIAILLGTVVTISSSFFFSSTASPKTFYLTDALASGANHMVLQDGGSAPATARITTGWIAGTTAPTVYARLDSQTERTAASQGATVQPDGNPDNTLGDCFRTSATITGSFASGNWTYSFPVQGETRSTSTHDGKLRVRLYRSTSATGASPTEIGSAQVTTAYANLANSAAQTVTVTFNPGAISLTAEYLFFQIAHQLDGVGNNAGSDTHLTVGTDSKITTSAFTP